MERASGPRKAPSPGRELRRKLDLGLQIATGRGMTVGEYLTSWARDTLALQVESGDLQASTADSYRDLGERRLVPGLGQNRLEELKPVGGSGRSSRRSGRRRAHAGVRCRRARSPTTPYSVGRSPTPSATSW